MLPLYLKVSALRGNTVEVELVEINLAEVFSSNL